MAQGFSGGFIRGLGLGLILLGALSIYAGPRGRLVDPTPMLTVDDTVDDKEQTIESLQSQVPQVQVEASSPTPPDSSDITDRKNIPPLPQAPTIPAQEAETPNVAQPQIQQGTGTQAGNISGSTDSTVIEKRTTLPNDADAVGNALPDFDKLVVIPPDNAVAPAVIDVPSDPDGSTPALRVPAAPRLVPRPTPESGDIDANYAPIEAPQTFDIEALSPNTGDPFSVDRAINLHAAEPEILDDRPLIAVALIADRTLNLAQLDALDFPVSIVVAADHPDVAQWSEALRRKDQEVILTLDLTHVSTVQDIETNLAAVLAKSPKTIAVMEQSIGGLQKSRLHNEMVPEILSRSGHGLITYSNGLNTIQKNARANNLSSTVINENLIGLRQPEIERRLERALLEATKPSKLGALIVAELNDEILSTLAAWTGQDRTLRVQLVPVSQYLTITSQN